MMAAWSSLMVFIDGAEPIQVSFVSLNRKVANSSSLSF
jgi:hypothetical protein